MNGQSVATLRYIVTPTLKDISDQDREEFAAAEAQPVMMELSAENDQVSGTEKYYNYILHSQAVVAAELGSITGAEGLFSVIKNGVKKVIQIVKDFFKWIWSFFSAKGQKIDNKLQDIDHALKDKGVKAEEVRYPQSTRFIYPKPGKPAKDLSWVTETNNRIAKGITNVGSYANALTEHLGNLERLNKDKKSVSEMTQATLNYQGKIRTIFSTGGKEKGTFITVDDFRFGPMRITYSPTSNSAKDFQGSTFTTSQSVVEEIRKESVANLKLLKTLTVDLAKLEKTMVDTLTLLSNNKDTSSGVQKVFASIINNSLEDIRMFEYTLYKAVLTVTDLCRATIK